jgi:hypothetical protein
MRKTAQVFPKQAENAGMAKNTTFRTVIEFAEIETLFDKLPRRDLETFRRTVNVSRRTWRRWERGEARIPVAVWLAARYVTGDMSYHSRKWDGLRVRGEGIAGSPYGMVPATEIHCWPWLRALYRRNYHHHTGETPCTKQLPSPSPFLVLLDAPQRVRS